MIIGHSLLAFTVVALFALWRGYGREQAMYFGVFAGLFAVLPDVDILYAWKEVLVVFTSGLPQFVDSFWAASNVIHRGISHSLVTGVIAASLFGFYYRNRKSGFVAVPALAALGFFAQGYLGAAVMAVFGIGGLLITDQAREYLDGEQLLLVAGFGLLSHPFGDLFTGTPPDLFYPLGLNLFPGRVVLAADPVMNLLAIFMLEMSVVAAALVAFSYLEDRRVSRFARGFSLLGVLYAPAVFVIPAPTLGVSYQFVFSILLFGVLVTLVIPAVLDSYRPERSVDDFLFISVNVVSTLSVAFVSYFLVYFLAF